MAYVKPEPPADSDVLFTDADGRAFTWGEHRAMSRSLRELEQSDPVVMASRKRLDEMLINAGFDLIPKAPILLCEFCGKDEYHRHEEDCPDYWTDAPHTREAGGYKYLDDKFIECHVTSAPMTDLEALEYFSVVQLMFPRNPEHKTKYILKREIHGIEWKMMPFTYDSETGMVDTIEPRSDAS